MEPLLEIRNLTCGYQTEPVFTRVNLALYPKQLSGLVGPSGSGKSTLIKAMLGLVHPWQGEILVRGKRLKPGTSPPKVGYVPQVETVDWNFPVTAEEVVMMGRYRQRQFSPWSSRRDRLVARELLERVGVAHVAHQPIGELSGGQQQRVFLARALVGEPELVLLDEPTSGSDLHVQHELLHLLAELSQQGLSVLLSTHDLNSVATHLPWVVCFNQGVVCQGEPTEVFTPATLRQTFGADMLVLRQEERVLISSDATTLLHELRNDLPPALRQNNSRSA
ncbi:MAG: metal ABC transporter ATP-binding protein [Phormidesmis sp. CAN_BIN44]|nr:metal ABC transporter ATP-binding protein [Phormidesmis sp. CAN_BIN44]